MKKNVYVYGELLPGVETISEGDARLLVWIARHARISRVHRYGRRGQRRWVLEPRNKAEHLKRKGVLR